jgi:malonate-semialdehyde dehydrogenase (acetylating)/methylmalonate-semialdehyde dehydrogenase
METLGHFIDGARVSGSGPTTPITDPSTGKTTRQVALGTAADVDKAVAAAARAFPAWAATPAPRRAAVMFRFKALIEQHADELAG